MFVYIPAISVLPIHIQIGYEYLKGSDMDV